MWNDVNRAERERKLKDLGVGAAGHLSVKEKDTTQWTELKITPTIKEHIDVALEWKVVGTRPMKEKQILITVDEIKRQINKLKTNKAPGPERIKTELY